MTEEEPKFVATLVVEAKEMVADYERKCADISKRIKAAQKDLDDNHATIQENNRQEEDNKTILESTKVYMKSLKATPDLDDPDSARGKYTKDKITRVAQRVKDLQSEIRSLQAETGKARSRVTKANRIVVTGEAELNNLKEMLHLASEDKKMIQDFASRKRSRNSRCAEQRTKRQNTSRRGGDEEEEEEEEEQEQGRFIFF